MTLSEWRKLPARERALAWQNMTPDQRQELWINLAATTPGYALPYPTDYNDPSDSPLAFRELAIATDNALLLKIDESVANARFLDEAEGNARYSPHGHTHNYAANPHYHSAQEVGFRFSRFGVGNVGGGQTIRKVVAHGLGRTPTIAIATAFADSGSTLSGVVSVETMDASNVVWLIRNLNNSTTEYLDVSWLVA